MSDEFSQQVESVRAQAPAEPSGPLHELPELVPESDGLIGTLVGDRYLIAELVGRGGMGAVYRAEHIHMRKAVALKVLHRELTAQPEVVARFEREAIAAGRIEHPNVVQAHDFGRLPEGAFYLVLEYVEGQGLGQALLQAQGHFPIERVLSITGQIAEALVAAHAQGIVHRDLKPDNVMLVARAGEPELVKVMDFGIAKISLQERGESVKQITQVGSVFGTPEYMSPEQAAGQSVDERADLYALGLLMYRMLAGHPPFSGEEVQAVLMMQITQTPPDLDPAIPLAVRDLVFDLLHKAPDDRIQSAAEVVDRVLAILGADMTPAISKTRAKLVSVGQSEQTEAGWLRRLNQKTLAQRWMLGGRRVSLVRLSLVALVATLMGGLLVVLAFDQVPLPEPVMQFTAPEPEQESSPVFAPAGPVPSAEDPELERLLGKVFVGEKDAVEALERKPAARRGIREWLALARGLVKNRRFKDALDAYAEALRRQPTVSQDAVLRRDIINAAREPETAEQALRLAADYMGSEGADLLYKIWVDTREVTAATSVARELVYRDDVRGGASPALQFLLSWREAIGCDEYRKLLPDATLHADQRALTLFNRAKLKNQCGLTQDAIEAAILAAKDRQQPAPF